MQPSLFDTPLQDIRREGLAILRGFALPEVPALLAGIDHVVAAAPFRHMNVPGGGTMSVAMTNCGAAGWVTDAKSYRYAAVDPLNNVPWPEMPEVFSALAQRAACAAGFGTFMPDACLINRYEAGAKMGLHQDRDEAYFGAPIVSVSLGLPARFQFGGLMRKDPVETIVLVHGDVAVWGGPLRKAFHGVAPLKAGLHESVGAKRFNLTMRKAL